MYLANYLKIVEYFKLKNPKIIMDVNLENFTNNSEEISKEIFKFCNLTWSKDVCKFYEREDLFSKTLSFAQIRNQVTKYDEKKYKSYFYLLKDHKKKYIWLDKK